MNQPNKSEGNNHIHIFKQRLTHIQYTVNKPIQENVSAVRKETNLNETL